MLLRLFLSYYCAAKSLTQEMFWRQSHIINETNSTKGLESFEYAYFISTTNYFVTKNQFLFPTFNVSGSLEREIFCCASFTTSSFTFTLDC